MTMLVGGGAGSTLGEDIVSQAQKLESLGHDSLSVGETSHNPFLPLVLVAEHTKKLQFGTSVAIAFPRAPHISANLAWDLHIYPFLWPPGLRFQKGSRVCR